MHGGTGRSGRTLTAFDTSSRDTQFTAFLGRGTRLGGNGSAGAFPFSGDGAGGTNVFTGTLPFGRFGANPADSSSSGAITDTRPFGLNGFAGTNSLLPSTAPVTATATIIASSDGRRVYVATHGDRMVTAYDARRGRLLAIYPLQSAVKDIALSLDSTYVYALTDSGLFAFDSTAVSAPQAIPLVLPADVAADATRVTFSGYQSQHWIVVTLPARDQVAVLDLSGQNPVQLVGVGRDPVAMAPISGSDNLVVANKGKASLSLLSLSRPHVADTIAVRSNPSLLAIP